MYVVYHRYLRGVYQNIGIEHHLCHKHLENHLASVFHKQGESILRQPTNVCLYMQVIVAVGVHASKYVLHLILPASLGRLYEFIACCKPLHVCTRSVKVDDPHPCVVTVQTKFGHVCFGPLSDALGMFSTRI